jgi:hypothetical protein
MIVGMKGTILILASLVVIYAVLRLRSRSPIEERPTVPQWVYINELEVTQGYNAYPFSDRWFDQLYRELRTRVH